MTTGLFIFTIIALSAVGALVLFKLMLSDVEEIKAGCND